MSTTTVAEPVIVLRKADRRPMAGGGTVTYEVYLDGRWIGWVGDGRRFTGSRYAGRRWWAVHREDGDTNARWNTFDGSGHRTRDAARDALLARVRGT